jgi:hypothetical protein
MFSVSPPFPVAAPGGFDARRGRIPCAKNLGLRESSKVAFCRAERRDVTLCDFLYHAYIQQITGIRGESGPGKSLKNRSKGRQLTGRA